MGDVFNQRTAVRAVFKAPLRSSEKLVMLAIIDHWSKKYPKPCPGLTRLAQLTGLTRPTVIVAINDLVADGAIPKPESGVRGAHVFELSGLVSNLDQLDPSRLVRNLDRSKKRTGKNTPPRLVKNPSTTGKTTFTNPQQNGSISSEESKEESKEESIEESNLHVADSDAPFELTSPSSKKAASKGKSKRRARSSQNGKPKPKKQPEFSAEVREPVRLAYFECYRRARGDDPPWNSREQKSLNTILRAFGGDPVRSERVVSNAFVDPFWARQSTINSIAKDPARFDGTQRRANGQASPQTNTGANVTAGARRI